MAVRPFIAMLLAGLALAAFEPAMAATATGTASSTMSVRLTLANPCAATANTMTSPSASTFEVACTDGAAPQVHSSDAANVGIRALSVTDAGALRIEVVEARRDTAAGDEVTLSVVY
jgi:hypothetical protein